LRPTHEDHNADFKAAIESRASSAGGSKPSGNSREVSSYHDGFCKGKGIFYVNLWDQVDPSDDTFLLKNDILISFPRISPGTQSSTPHQVQGENLILAQGIEFSTFRLSGTRSTTCNWV